MAALPVGFWLHPLTQNVTNEADIWMLATQCQKEYHGTDILAKVFANLQSYKGKEVGEAKMPKKQVWWGGGGITGGDVGLNNMGISSWL